MGDFSLRPGRVDRGRHHSRVLRRELSEEVSGRIFAGCLPGGERWQRGTARLSWRSCRALPSSLFPASVTSPDRVLFNGTLKPISSFNLWRPHTCPTLVFTLDDFHPGEFLGFLSIPGMLPGLRPPLPSPVAPGEPSRTHGQGIKRGTELPRFPPSSPPPPREASRAKQGSCCWHREGLGGWDTWS